MVDGNPGMVLQLCYAVATFACLKDWALRPPPTLPPAPGAHQKACAREPCAALACKKSLLTTCHPAGEASLK
jgi:hypothetical protein